MPDKSGTVRVGGRAFVNLFPGRDPIGSSWVRVDQIVQVQDITTDDERAKYGTSWPAVVGLLDGDVLFSDYSADELMARLEEVRDA